MKTTRSRQLDNNVAITFRVMSLRLWTRERFRKHSKSLDGRLITRERDGYVRAGTTLTEVLMSLMIMSIGVVSVATLFPIATLRTLEANKQTNSTITSFLANALVDVDPQFIHDPDGTFPNLGVGSPGLTSYNGSTFRATNYFVDPLGWQSINRDNLQPAPSGIPVPYSLRDYFGAKPSTVNIPLPRRYNGASLFPNYPGVISPYPSTATEALAAVVRAGQLVTQPDSWKLVAETSADTAVSATTNITSLTLDSEADLSSIDPAMLTAAYPGVVYRAVIFDSDDARHSEVRYLTAVTTSPPTITWAAGQPLPTIFESGNIGKVRIEHSDEIYTWMLSVRKRASGTTNVDVVVFFKRGFGNPDFENAHFAPFRTYTLGLDGVPGTNLPIPPGPGGVTYPIGDDNRDGVANDIGEIGYPYSDDEPNNRVLVTFTLTEDTNGNGSLDAGEDMNVNGSLDTFDPPVLKRGGYVYDTRNGLWYRIRAIEGETAISATLVLDEAIKANSTEDLNINGTLDPAFGEDSNFDTILQQGGAILHPRVVNVFPLEIKEP